MGLKELFARSSAAALILLLLVYVFIEYDTIYSDIMFQYYRLSRGGTRGRTPRIDELPVLHSHDIKSLRHVVPKPSNHHMKIERVYVVGLVKGMQRDYMKGISWNLGLLLGLSPSSTAIIYADNYSEILLNGLNDERVTLIKESEHPLLGASRTTRLAYGRNMLLQRVLNLSMARNEDISQTCLIVIDLDNVSKWRFSSKTILSAMGSRDHWDVVSFSRRDYYYDIWALRYPPYDFNLFTQDDVYGQLDIIEDDITKRLANLTEGRYFPVLSAFNGIAIYKLNYTVGCLYEGVPKSFKGINDMKDGNGSDDCEHVSFHRCMINRNGARIVIDKSNI